MDVLKNKQLKEYDYLSRYSPFYIAYNTKDKKYIYEVTNNLKDNTPFVVHKIQPYDTLDSLSLHYYGRPDYYWIIADFNRIQDPLAKITSLKSIKIPNISSIEYED